MWGLMLREWKGAGKRVYRLIALGLVILVVSTLVVGLGNYLASEKNAQPAPKPLQTRPADVTLTAPTGPARPIASENQGAFHDGA